MPTASLGSVDIYFESQGPEAGQPLVLIPGLGSQLIAWYDPFCALLVDAGFRVIRFDNRDSGLSGRAQSGYTTSDMAGDVANLIHHLGYGAAHVVGQSMGGVIAQQLAVSHPEVVRSLCIFYSAPHIPSFRVVDAEAQKVRGAAPAASREEAIAQWIERERISGLDGFDEAWIARFARTFVERAYSPEGQLRQESATLNNPDLGERLRELRQPTVVIHGREDRLVSWKGGVAIADAVRGSELHVFAGMGHQVRPDLWADYAELIQRNATRAN
jgi:pimeloyl-ACP methyl ester carboxylesterase